MEVIFMISKILATLFIGAVAGWLAGKIMNAGGSLGRNIIIGVIGSVVGGFVGSLIGIYSRGWIGSIIIATLGACLAIYLARKFLK